MTNDFTVQVIVGIISAVPAFFSGLVLAMLLESIRRKRGLESIKAALKMELQYIRDLIKEKKPVFKSSNNGSKFDVAVFLVDIPILDSIVHSGEYHRLDIKAQKQLSNLRGTVSQGNQLMMKLVDMRYVSLS